MRRDNRLNKFANFQLHLEENKKVHTNMMMKLKSLWTRMELEEKEQKLFLDQHTGYSDAVVVRIKEEVMFYIVLTEMIGRSC